MGTTDAQKELEAMNSELEEAGGEPINLENESSSKDDQESEESEETPKGKSEDDEKEPDESSDEEEEESDEDEDEESEKEEAEDESEDEEEEAESEDEDEDDEDHVESRHPRKHGYSRNKVTNLRNLYHEAREEAEYWKGMAERKGEAKADTEHKAEDELKETVRALAAELKTPEEQTEKLVTTIVNLARKNAIPPQLQARLDAFEKSEATAERSAAFEKEWDNLLPYLEEEYPNASPRQLSLAKQAMDIIAHSERFHEIRGRDSLEFIFKKTRKDFADILFSPKKKGFESSRMSGADRGRETSGKRLSIPDPNSATPESIAALEDFLNNAVEAEGGNKIRVELADGTETELE